MNNYSPQSPEDSSTTLTARSSVPAPRHSADPPAEIPANRGSPEGRYLAGQGKSGYRHVTGLQSQEAAADARRQAAQTAVGHALSTDTDRKDNHRGGDRPWALRLLIPVGVLAEAVTAYVAMEALVTSQSLAVGLSALTATVGCGMACLLANRRLNRLDVPATIRIVEGIFVAVLTVLRYESLSLQGAGYLAAAGAAALAAIISALGLLGIEEIVVETRSFGIFVASLRVSWTRWRSAAAASRLARIRARVHAAAGKLQQHYLDYLLRSEGLALEEARRRAAALRAALADGET
jgi:hypothetical protein